MARQTRAAPQPVPNPIQGGLIGIERDGIIGWAWDTTQPAASVPLRLFAGDELVGEAVANQFDDERVRTLVGPGVPGMVARLAHAPSVGYPFALTTAGPGWRHPRRPLVVRTAAEIADLVGHAPMQSYEGHLDGVFEGALMGWVWDRARPDLQVELELLDGGLPVDRAVANRLREDLRDAGLHHGQYGYAFDLPLSLLDGKPHSLSVRVAGTGILLRGGPIAFGPLASSALITQISALRTEVAALRTLVDELIAPDGTMQRRVLGILSERISAQADIQREQQERDMAALRMMVLRGDPPTPQPASARRPAPRADPAMESRPELIIFAPLPPMPTGIADYVYELLPGLSETYACTVVAEDGIADLRVPPGTALLCLSDYQADPARHAALHLYHLGNNPDHVYMLPALARRPGVVVLHDPSLHNLLDNATAALGDQDGYCAAIEAEYGAPGRLLAEQWRTERLRDRQMLFEMPMLRQLLGPARHVIVHSRHACHKVLREAPETPVTIAPHQFLRPPIRQTRAQTRQQLGIEPDEIVFLSLGFVSHIKRIDTALRALSRIADRLPPFRYVIAGELRREDLDVEALADRLGLARHILVTGFVPEAYFFPMIDMADVVINLRYPVNGETSGTLIRALGSGACVVVVDHGPFAELPDGAALRLPWGPDFEHQLGESLLELAITPALRARIGARAASEIGRRHSLDLTLAAYRAAIDAALAAPDRPWRSRTEFTFAPSHHRPGPEAPLWQQWAAAPAAQHPGPCLAIAAAGDIAALRGLNHTPDLAAAGWQPEHESPRSRDLLFVVLTPGHALLDAPDLLVRLNRVLSFDGILVLILHGIPPRRHPLAASLTGAAVFRACGFRIDLCASASPPSLAEAARPAQDQMVWRAIKISEFFARAVPVDHAA